MYKEQAAQNTGLNKENKEDQRIKAKNQKKNKVKLVMTKGEMFQGTLNPISIFPEEIWAMILAHVSSLDRLATCCTNSQLDTAFGEFKNEWLLDQVLPFLLKHFTHKSHLLKCRQVGKTWRRFINSFLESEHPCRRPYQTDHPLEQVFCRMPTIYNSRCGLEYLQFTPNTAHKFSSCPDPCGPLVGRAISFQISFFSSMLEVEAFWIQARTFLELQGGALWHFKIVVSRRHWDTQDFYLNLRECLSLLPNLKTLELRYRQYNPYSSSFEYREIGELIAANPLPVLPHLHSIDIEGVPQVIQEHCFKQFNSQLKRLSLDIDQFCYKCNLPNNLVELFVKRISSDELHYKLCTMPTIYRNCQKLTLDMSVHRQVCGHDLLKMLMQYPQLSHFRLILDSPPRFTYGNESLKGMSDVMPGVEYFEIEGECQIRSCFSSLLLKFPNLKYLHIRDTSNPGHDGNRQVRKYVSDAKVEIEQYLYSHKPEESPIWDTLGQLEVLTFENIHGSFGRFCTREQVKHYRGQKKA